MAEDVGRGRARCSGTRFRDLVGAMAMEMSASLVLEWRARTRGAPQARRHERTETAMMRLLASSLHAILGSSAPDHVSSCRTAYPRPWPRASRIKAVRMRNMGLDAPATLPTDFYSRATPWVMAYTARLTMPVNHQCYKYNRSSSAYAFHFPCVIPYIS